MPTPTPAEARILASLLLQQIAVETMRTAGNALRAASLHFEMLMHATGPDRERWNTVADLMGDVASHAEGGMHCTQGSAENFLAHPADRVDAESVRQSIELLDYRLAAREAEAAASLKPILAGNEHQTELFPDTLRRYRLVLLFSPALRALTSNTHDCRLYFEVAELNLDLADLTGKPAISQFRVADTFYVRTPDDAPKLGALPPLRSKVWAELLRVCLWLGPLAAHIEDVRLVHVLETEREVSLLSWSD